MTLAFKSLINQQTFYYWLQIYRRAQNEKPEENVFSVPLLPVIVGEDDETIIEYDSQIFITKLPNVARLSTRQMKRYNGYKGTRLLEGDTIMKDVRFQGLSDSLSENKEVVARVRSKKKKKEPFFLTKRSLTYM